MLILAAPPDAASARASAGRSLGRRGRTVRLAFISVRITRACAAAQLAAIRVGAAPEGRSRPTHRERPTARGRAAAEERWRHHGPAAKN